MIPKLGYETYREANAGFEWEEAWSLVDGTPDSINATAECLDRHEGTAARIQYADGSTSTHGFGELSRRAAQFAHLLADAGVDAGDAVAIMLDPSMEFLASFFGAMKRGAVAVPCSELFGPDALEYRLVDSGASVLVTSGDTAASIDAGHVDLLIERGDLPSAIDRYPASYRAETAGDDVAWLQYTSGTTGRPTAVPYHHESVALFAPVMDFVLDFDADDVCLTTSSTGWGTGIWIGLFSPLLYGVSSGFYSGRFDPDLALDAIDDFDVTTLLGVVPTAFRKLVDAAGERTDPPRVGKANYVGEPIDPDLSRAVEETLGAFPRSTYGVTEVRSIVTLDYWYPDYELRHGSMGKPLFGVEVTVLDDDGRELPPDEVGTIAVRRSEEWILTSDAGYYDEDGYFWSAGRADDTIISAGYTIGPQEVEDALRRHPDVADAGVIGVPDDERGEVVKAFVAAATPPEDEAAFARDVRAFVRERLSKHEYPREVELVDSIPQTPDGKIRRGALREREGIADDR